MKCRICGNTETNAVYDVREMMFGMDESFRYFQCAECQCLQIATVPENLAAYYPADYYAYNDQPEKKLLRRFLLRLRNRYAVSGKSAIIGKILDKRHGSLAHRSLRTLSLQKDARILDVGCGVGSFLWSLKDMGFKNVLGVDPFNERDIHYESGLQIRKAHLDEIEGSWDVVMFHHSFEHVSDPKDTLARVANLLAPEGCCVIRIPTVSSFAWREYGVDWVQLDAPRHLFLHSSKSMQVLAEQVGLKVDGWVCDSTAGQFVGSERYRRGIPLEPRDKTLAVDNQQLFSKRERRSYARLARELNAAGEGDQAIYYLRKSTVAGDISGEGKSLGH